LAGPERKTRAGGDGEPGDLLEPFIKPREGLREQGDAKGKKSKRHQKSEKRGMLRPRAGAHREASARESQEKGGEEISEGRVRQKGRQRWRKVWG